MGSHISQRAERHRKLRDVVGVRRLASRINFRRKSISRNGGILQRFGVGPDQFVPFQMTMLLPDLVVAVGLEFERHGLNLVPNSRFDSARPEEGDEGDNVS